LTLRHYIIDIDIIIEHWLFHYWLRHYFHLFSPYWWYFRHFHYYIIISLLIRHYRHFDFIISWHAAAMPLFSPFRCHYFDISLFSPCHFIISILI
jgi:hypothetical protein